MFVNYTNFNYNIWDQNFCDSQTEAIHLWCCIIYNYACCFASLSKSFAF